jgi:hypothetical protein
MTTSTTSASIAAISKRESAVKSARVREAHERTLTDWNAFEKACVRHGVRLSAYTGGTCGATARAASIEGACALGVSPGPVFAPIG